MSGTNMEALRPEEVQGGDRIELKGKEPIQDTPTVDSDHSSSKDEEIPVVDENGLARKLNNSDQVVKEKAEVSSTAAVVDGVKSKEERVEELLQTKVFADPFHTEYSDPPFIKHEAFNPSDILGCDASSWCDVLRNLSPRLPVQLHCEPFNIIEGPNPESQPIFRNTVNFLKGIPEVAELLKDTLPSGELSRARIKLRLGTSGKFIHRNRFKRRQIIMCLYGQATWLFLSSYGGASDIFLNRAANKNWCGFRSGSYSSMLSVEEMKNIVANLPEGVVGKLVTFKAGDMMEFDGRWWHATSYTNPVLSLFFTPGEDMEAAVSQHKERHSQPKHKAFQLCKISMAKTAKLSSTWAKDEKGNNITYGQDEGFYTLKDQACEMEDDDC